MISMDTALTINSISIIIMDNKDQLMMKQLLLIPLTCDLLGFYLCAFEKKALQILISIFGAN